MALKTFSLFRKKQPDSDLSRGGKFRKVCILSLAHLDFTRYICACLLCLLEDVEWESIGVQIKMCINTFLRESPLPENSPVSASLKANNGLAILKTE